MAIFSVNPVRRLAKSEKLNFKKFYIVICIRRNIGYPKILDFILAFLEHSIKKVLNEFFDIMHLEFIGLGICTD